MVFYLLELCHWFVFSCILELIAAQWGLLLRIRQWMRPLLDALMNLDGNHRFCIFNFTVTFIFQHRIMFLLSTLQKVSIVESDGCILRAREVSWNIKEFWIISLLPLLIADQSMQTYFPVNEMAKALSGMGYDVAPSDDAGRFVCNYVYYHSLRFAEQHGIKSLFVHVPLFLTICEETQMQFVASLLELLPSLN